MSEKVKIYHVETQEDYDDLMIELENEGCMWESESLPTSAKYWNTFKGNTYITLNKKSKRLTYGYMGLVDINYPDIPVIKHKVKGVEQMEKVVVPQFVADWYVENKPLTIYGLMCDFVTTTNNKNKKITHWKEAIGSGNAQEIIAKMHLYGYEVEEKKYYWRKKKEHILEFETTVESIHLTYSHITGHLFFSDSLQSEGYQTKFTETEVKQLVSEEDFNKLERVEIDDVQ